MRFVLSYDVVEDRLRSKLFKRLRQWLHPVQRSVFEGAGEPKMLADLEGLVHRTVDLEVDSVRIYALCASCAARVRHHGVAGPLRDPADPVVW